MIDLTVNGVRVTLMPTASSRAERSPDMQESARFLDLADQVLERFRPHVLLTYGGHPACLELMRRARMKSVAVVFHLHNFGYNDRKDGTGNEDAVRLRGEEILATSSFRSSVPVSVRPGELLGIEGWRTTRRRNDLIGFGHWWGSCARDSTTR